MNAPQLFRPLRITLCCTVCVLILSVCFFAPHLWLMCEYQPGTFQWDRAHTFLLQCEEPFRRDIEPAMLWRLLPPLVCHALGLRGWGALILPWLGAAVASFYAARLHIRRLPDARFVFGGTLLFATTSAVLVPVSWLGINDGWMWLGLLAVAFAESPLTCLAACLLCPWVDERFLIGLPLALAVRQADAPGRFGWRALAPLLGLLPYVALRLAFSSEPAIAGPTRQLLSGQFNRNTFLVVPWAPLAWWMGLRAAWLAAAYAIRLRPWLLGGGAAATLIVCLVLAADMSRSAAILTPLVLCGTFAFAARHPSLAPRATLTAGIANLLIPAAHITLTKFDPINNLAIELLRLLRIH